MCNIFVSDTIFRTVIVPCCRLTRSRETPEIPGENKLLRSGLNLSCLHFLPDQSTPLRSSIGLANFCLPSVQKLVYKSDCLSVNSQRRLMKRDTNSEAADQWSGLQLCGQGSPLHSSFPPAPTVSCSWLTHLCPQAKNESAMCVRPKKSNGERHHQAAGRPPCGQGDNGRKVDGF